MEKNRINVYMGYFKSRMWVQQPTVDGVWISQSVRLVVGGVRDLDLFIFTSWCVKFH